MLQELGVEVLKRLLKSVRLGSRDRAFDNGLFDTSGGEMAMQKLHGITKATSIVASERPHECNSWLAVFGRLRGVLMNKNVDLVLSLQLRHDLIHKFRRLEELDQSRGAGQHQLVVVGYHSLRESA